MSPKRGSDEHRCSSGATISRACPCGERRFFLFFEHAQFRSRGLPSSVVFAVGGGSKTARICSLSSFECACPAFFAGQRGPPACPRALPPACPRRWFSPWVGEAKCFRFLETLRMRSEGASVLTWVPVYITSSKTTSAMTSIRRPEPVTALACSWQGSAAAQNWAPRQCILKSTTPIISK
jgi:hypothetical protein